MNITQLHQNDPAYPSALQKYLSEHAPKNLMAMGNLDLLRGKTLALFCSVQCPGKQILQTYDFVRKLRSAKWTVIGGFHSPMERQSLELLLSSFSSVIICPARAIEKMRVPSEHKKPLAEGRLLFLSPFPAGQRRATAEMALYRNRLVAALADSIFVAYAEPRGKTEQFSREVLAWRKPLYTLEGDANGNLLSMGAEPLTPKMFVGQG